MIEQDLDFADEMADDPIDMDRGRVVVAYTRLLVGEPVVDRHSTVRDEPADLMAREKDKLLVAVAAMVARRRLERGVRLNYPEAVALITDFVLEGAGDGLIVADLMRDGALVLKRRRVMDGIPRCSARSRSRRLSGRDQARHRPRPDPVTVMQASPLDSSARRRDAAGRWRRPPHDARRLHADRCRSGHKRGARVLSSRARDPLSRPGVQVERHASWPRLVSTTLSSGC